jgi:ABC-type antimicrobial peptide transport system permease subunit
MAVGMACAILLLLWVQNEFSYDRFHKNPDSLFRVLHTVKMEGDIRHLALTQYPLAAALKEECPEIIRSTRYYNTWSSFTKDNNVVEGVVASVDYDFLDMFSVSFVRGDKNNALKEPGNIIITEDMANRYFGKDDPVGKVMKCLPNRLFTVTGVIRNYPRNSHFYLDCIISSDFIGTDTTVRRNDLNSWVQINTFTFIEIAKGADPGIVEQKITGIVKSKLEGLSSKISSDEFFLQNIRKIHLYSRGKYQFDVVSGSIVYVRLAILLAVLMLTIACVNFMNLTTALSAKRSREIGIRKAAGASRLKIIFQFMGESLLLVFAAHIIAMILVELFLPEFSRLLFTNLEINYKSFVLYLGLVVIMFFCAVAGGSYPSFFMSSVNPANILKSNDNQNKGSARLRKVLVISQFTISLLFIICTLIVKGQLNFLQNNNTGLSVEDVCHFEFYGIKPQILKNSLLDNPEISSVTITSQNPNYFWNPKIGFNWEGKNKDNKTQFNVLNTDQDFINTYQPVLISGSYLSPEYSTGIVINEKAAKTFGFDDPVGKAITWNGLQLTIIGVLRDFHYGSMHYAIDPLLIMNSGADIMQGTCNFRVKSGNIKPTLDFIRGIYKSNNFGYPLDFKFIEDDYKIMYYIERAAGSLFGYLSILAMLISCLGLIGLSIFMTLRRTKEIGIRKINGAKPGEILLMLTKQYLRLISISFLIAAPISWVATNIWLRSFAYRIKAGPGVYILSLIIVVVITMLTIGFQSYKAAGKNPVDALRYE